MRKYPLLLLLLLSTLVGLAQAQPKTPADFGYRHLRIRYQRDTADILVLSKKSDELKRKPVFFFAQGSLPTPLIKVGERGPYSIFSFYTKDFLPDYYLVLVSKPSVPLIADSKTLRPGFTQADPKTGLPPIAYCQRNYFEYYLARRPGAMLATAAPWATPKALRLWRAWPSGLPLRRVVQLSGSPLGRMLTMLSCYHQTEADSVITASQMSYWQQMPAAPRAYDCTKPGDSNLITAPFSESQSALQDFLHTKIPVFVGYGTRGVAVVANECLRPETIRTGKTTFTFHAYPGLEHNFFGFTNDKIDYDKWNWDRVAYEFFA